LLGRRTHCKTDKICSNQAESGHEKNRGLVKWFSDKYELAKELGNEIFDIAYWILNICKYPISNI